MSEEDGNVNRESVVGGELARAPSAADEMNACDRLGPLARAAFERTPIKFLAWTIVRQCDANGWNPRSQRVDEHLARCIDAGSSEIEPVVPSDFHYDRVAAALARCH